MLTESFHGSPSARRDLSVSVGTRGPYSRDLWSTYMIPFCRKEMCALSRNKVITFILRLCHFPISGVRAHTFTTIVSPESHPVPKPWSNTRRKVEGTILTSGLLTMQPQKPMPGREKALRQSQPGLVNCWWIPAFWSPCLGSCIALLSRG